MPDPNRPPGSGRAGFGVIIQIVNNNSENFHASYLRKASVYNVRFLL